MTVLVLEEEVYKLAKSESQKNTFIYLQDTLENHLTVY